MAKKDSLCTHCRSCMFFRYRDMDLQNKWHVVTGGSCKQGFYQMARYIPEVVSCSEFSDSSPGVSINACPTKIKGGIGNFYVQVVGECENKLCSSLEDAMEAAADLLKKELIKHKGGSHTKA